MRVILVLVISLLGWGGLMFNFIKDGNGWAAFFASLPFIAFLLFTLKPTRNFGMFALSHQFKVVEEEGLTERSYHLKMAKMWFLGFLVSWFLGSLVLPISFLFAFIFQQSDGFVIVCGFIGLMLGIPCFLKALGSLYSAIKANS